MDASRRLKSYLFEKACESLRLMKIASTFVMEPSVSVKQPGNVLMELGRYTRETSALTEISADSKFSPRPMCQSQALPIYAL